MCSLFASCIISLPGFQKKELSQDGIMDLNSLTKDKKNKR
jgi:hypothetical protein